jgi:parallel beta-helix repeat protein
MHQSALESPARALVVLTVALLVVTAGLPGGVTGTEGRTAQARTIDDCRTIDEPGEYALGGNVTTDGNCLEVTADGVTIDGNGYTLAGDGSWTAIRVTDADDVTVRNVTLANWSTGVALRGATDARIVGTTVTDANVVGVTVDERSHDATVRDTTIANGSAGLRSSAADTTVAGSTFTNLLGSVVDLRGDDGRVVNNTVRATGGAAVTVTAVDDALVANNSVRNTIGGITVTDSAGVAVRGNTLRDVRGASVRVAGDGEAEPARNRPKPGALSPGVTFVSPVPSGVADDLASVASTGGADGSDAGDGESTRRYVDVTLAPPEPPEPVRIVGNAILDGNGNGIFVTNATSTAVIENTIMRNRDGVRIVGGEDATVRNNSVSENRDDGVQIAGSPDATVRNNTLVNNSDDGLYVVSNGTVVFANVARGNGDDGVDVQGSTLLTLHDNRLLENTDDGLYLRNVVNATVERNDLRHNLDDGIDLRGTTGAVVVDNAICWNEDDDFIERLASEGTVARNNSC